ncbi:MAG: MFS transporter [Candidatus Bathyarchaeota archaeon]|nr:MAG: MFS transporter [Candidatus Bathyarchaeota archaeon]
MTRFSVIFTGQAFSLFGSRLVQFAIVWWLTSESGSPSVLALASIMALLPQVFISPFAGTLVDRWNRRLVMIVADSILALIIVILALLYATGVVQIWHIYAAMFLRSVGGAFHWPTMQATTSLMVPQEHLSRVAGLNQSLQGLANIFAPPLGALLLSLMPIQNILYIDIATAVLAIIPLFVIPIPQPVRRALAGGWRSVLDDMREGGRYVWDWRGLRYVMTLSMVINLLITPAFSLLPILVTEHFGGGALQLAWMQSASGIGMILGGLTLGVWGGFKRQAVTAFTMVIIAGVFVAAVGFTPAYLFLLAVGFIFTFAFTNAIANGTFFAMMQAIVPPEIQGRVFTLLMALSSGMSPLGLSIAGPVAELLGERIWFIAGGVVFSLMGVVAFFVPTIMNLEEEGARKTQAMKP